MNEQKNIKFQVVEDGKIVDLLPETTISQILMPDNTKLINKLAEMVSAINLRLKIEDYNSSTDTVKTEIQQWIDNLKQELMGDTPNSDYDTFTKLAAYINEHTIETHTMADTMNTKASKTETQQWIDNLKQEILGDTPNSDYDTFTKLAAYINEHTIETHTMADTMNTKASKTETQQWIADLKQEILGDTPVEAFDTFAELATYISEHQEISDALSGAIGTKASKTETQQWIADLKQELMGDTPNSDYDTFTKLAAYINEHTIETHTMADTMNTKASKTETQQWIDNLKQEILGNDPSESYNTFTKLASYINTHKGETDALTATVNLKANTETVNGIISRLDQLGALSTKNAVSMSELDSGLKQRMDMVDSLASATTNMHISDTKPEIGGLWFNTSNT